MSVNKHQSAPVPRGAGKALTGKIVAAFLVVVLLPPAIMFVAAGRYDWWEAWAMVAVLVVTTLVSRAILIVKYPDLALERARWTQGQDSKDWDRKLMPIVALYGPFLMWLTAGLDKRFDATSPLPLALELAAFAVVIAGYLFSTWAMITNRFFSSVFRIQTDREHAVVTGGPYRLVRHPGYAGGFVGYLATPIALGTLWVYLPALLTVVAVVVRTYLEDQALQAELPGYVEYTQRTRYRLLPGIW
jgi:protein-S-isoprenylcysteine O-methyltransferase Ste14